jgi:hypothetical protein
MHRGLGALLLAGAVLAPGAACRAAAPEPVKLNAPAPAFVGIDAWINSKPLDWKALRGKVVVVHFWTFG